MRCACCVTRMKSAPRIAPAAFTKRLASSFVIPARVARRAERYTCGALEKSGRATYSAGGVHETTGFYFGSPGKGGEACGAFHLRCAGKIWLRPGHAPQGGVACGDDQARARALRPVIAAAG